VVWQTAKRLQYNKCLAAVLCMVDNFTRDKHALTCIKGVVDDGVAVHHQLGQTDGPLVQGVRPGNGVGQIVGQIENGVYRIEPQLFAQGLFQAVLPDLGALVEVALLDDVGHFGFDDLEAVALQIQLNVVVGAGVEVEQILAHNKDLRSGLPAPHR